MNIFSTFFNFILGVFASLTNDWLISILLLTILIKFLLFPLTVKQQKILLLSQNLNQAKSILSNKFKGRSDKINECLVKIATKYKINPILPFITILIQLPILFSLYFSFQNFTSTAGSLLTPWITSVSKPDTFHILPIIAAIFQGLTGFTIQNKNIFVIALPMIMGRVFLWKAPAALSVYWSVNSLLNYLEKRIMLTKYFQRKFLTVTSTEEMLRVLD